MGEPENRSQQVLAVALVFLVLSYLTISLRIYVRAFMIKSFGRDDWAMCGVLALFTAYLTCQLGGVAHGTGQHRSALTDANAQIALSFWFFCEVFYTLTTSFLKVAIGLFLMRITIERIHTLIIKVLMVCCTVIGVVYCMIVLFQCRPVSFWWDLDETHTGKCLSPLLMVDATYVVSALNALADWVFAILPIFIVRDLHMKGSTKAVVVTILGLGAMGSTATIIRIPYLWTIKTYKGDFLYRSTDVAIWTTVEIGVGITAGNLATLRPLFQKFLDVTGLQAGSNSGTHRWSRSRKPTGGSRIAHIRSQVLDDLRGDGNKTITTVIGRAGVGLDSWADKSRESEEDMIREAHEDPLEAKAYGGISKSVAVTTVEERRSDDKTPVADEESGLAKPTLIYERL